MVVGLKLRLGNLLVAMLAELRDWENQQKDCKKQVVVSFCVANQTVLEGRRCKVRNKTSLGLGCSIT